MWVEREVGGGGEEQTGRQEGVKKGRRKNRKKRRGRETEEVENTRGVVHTHHMQEVKGEKGGREEVETQMYSSHKLSSF